MRIAECGKLPTGKMRHTGAEKSCGTTGRVWG